jgi:hypothetical protein
MRDGHVACTKIRHSGTNLYLATRKMLRFILIQYGKMWNDFYTVRIRTSVGILQTRPGPLGLQKILNFFLRISTTIDR